MTKPTLKSALVKDAKATFVWDDPLLLDSQLKMEERMVRDLAR